MILPIILSGGVGPRLWPLSRETHPKPFIKLDDGQSLLQKSYILARNISDSDEVVTVTNRDLFFYSKDEFEEIGVSASKNTFLLEPVGRNSAAAIAIAAHYALGAHCGDCTMLVMPADHLVHDMEAFSQAVKQAEKLAAQGKLVTFGIKPSAPEIGYGYILADGNKVEKFVEKPDKKTAETYIADGNYFWNSGMFCMRAGSFLEELDLLAPDIAAHAAKAVAGAKQSSADNWQALEMLCADFEHIRSISVDYAVFEKSQNVGIVPCDIGWSDIGSWNKLGALHPADEHKNNSLGNVMCKETNDCIIHGGERLIATLGVKNLIISDTVDALLIAHKDRVQEIRSIVDELKARNDTVYKEFPTVHRPWGTYTVLQEGVGFKLKRIEVKPSTRLSLQSHEHRSEHWVVVCGKALVTNGDDQIELTINQSTYIPLGNKHRLENPGAEQLILIEVQCGNYLGEDDIVRYEDVYGR
jgi:mannose-1-phosphate guanylyltransferase / mannose-6-phosphate isomerase